MEVTAGRGVRVFLSLSYHKAISPSLGTLFSLFFANFYGMQLSYSIGREDVPPESLCRSLVKRRGRGSVMLPALNAP